MQTAYIPIKTFPLKVIFIWLLTIAWIGDTKAQNILHDKKQDRTATIAYYFNNDEWEAGKKILDADLKKHPKDSELKMLMGRYYLHHKLYDKARYELKKALEYNPDNVGAKQILVNVEMESKRYSSAICYVNELLEINPYWQGLWRKKIELYRLQGNIVEADRLLKRISQIYPNDSLLHRDYTYETEMQAIEQRKQGNIDAAITLTSELVKLEPYTPGHYVNLSNDYIKAGDAYKALSYIDRGLTYTPNNTTLINKKVSILADQKRYAELLNFLHQNIRTGNTPFLQNLYNYYLLEAARHAKNSDPTILYGKILENSPDNEEAFNYVYNSLYGKQQYEEAMYVLKRYKHKKGTTKTIQLKELDLHKKMGNNGRVMPLVKQLFSQYPNDTDLKEEYVKIVFNDAKRKMTDGLYIDAIKDFNEIIQHGDQETVREAQNGLYNSAMMLNDHNLALSVLNDIISSSPNEHTLFIKQAEVYRKQKRYHDALASYEHAISLVPDDEKKHHWEGYGEMSTEIIKDLSNRYRYNEALDYIKRWLAQDSNNKDALHYAVNIAHKMKKYPEMYTFARMGRYSFPNDIFFKIKLAELDELHLGNYDEIYKELHKEIQSSPFHEELIKAFSVAGENYAKHLIKNKLYSESIVIIDTALRYSPSNRSLKYVKGIAFEKLHQYDSAHYYQSFYEPSITELSDFKQHLDYLKYKDNKNEIGIFYLRSRHGHDYTINAISTIEYSRYEKDNTYIGRVNYTGKETGKGFQLQGEWGHTWNTRTHTRIDFAWANKFFPKITLNGSVFRSLNVLGNIEMEVGIGYKRLPNEEHLSNVVLGVSKEIEKWFLNMRCHGYVLNHKGIAINTDNYETKWLFNLSSQVKYYLFTPKSYLVGTISVGTAPDVDIINYQFYNKFHGLNTTVGAGIGHMLNQTVSLGIIGSWNNYYYQTNKYRNLYNIYLTANVVF